MSLVDTIWYANSVAYAAVTPFAISTAYTVGQIRRQLTTPAVGSERVFIVIVAGTSAASEPTWVLTRGAKTISNTVTFMECTGQAALNGDLTNTTTWAAVKAATPAVLGQIIKRSSGASYQICTTAGAMSASEPAFSDTAGVTTTDTTAVWTSLGAVGSYTGGMAPFARLQSAFGTNWFSVGSGNTVYVASNHAETQATAMTVTWIGGTSSGLGRIICHNVSGSYPPASGDMTTGATVSASTASGTITLNINSLYVYGITFKGGVGASSGSGAFVVLSGTATSSQAWTYYDHCSFQVANTTASGGTVKIGSYALTLNNCKMSFGHAACIIEVAASTFRWQNTGTILESGSTVPTILFDTKSAVVSSVILEALDLSQISGAIFSNTTATFGWIGSLMIADCKLHASATVTTPIHTGMIVQLARSSA